MSAGGAAFRLGQNLAKNNFNLSLPAAIVSSLQLGPGPGPGPALRSPAKSARTIAIFCISYMHACMLPLPLALPLPLYYCHCLHHCRKVGAVFVFVFFFQSFLVCVHMQMQFSHFAANKLTVCALFWVMRVGEPRQYVCVFVSLRGSGLGQWAFATQQWADLSWAELPLLTLFFGG